MEDYKEKDFRNKMQGGFHEKDRKEQFMDKESVDLWLVRCPN
jgi:hypothetical protein